MSSTLMLVTIGIVSLVTIALRALPFLLFRGGRKPPAFVTWLGQQLPRAVMMMLVVYCLKDVNIHAAPHGLPALLACAVTAGLHLWRKQMSLSIFCGTAVYMVMIRVMGV